ncbi:pre-mRNA-processing factor 39-like isoform X2 [Oscarella lobularis]|uniref:pre-mRNA-processing factor 39-like isoform X2 n=1 Tax=Oscarella lobularis TaxID=121494 RepID=UPI0033136C29
MGRNSRLSFEHACSTIKMADDNSGATESAGISAATDVSEEQPPAMTEKERYWSAVRANPCDFDTWTYLLQVVESEDNIESVREAFEDFLQRYPYCFGYWKKFADMELRHSGASSASAVYRRGLEAISLSIDLWLHYLDFAQNYLYRLELGLPSVEKMQGLYEEAIKTAGLEFRSDRLWENYVEWAMAQNNFQLMRGIYDRLLTVPTQYYSKHFEQFREFVRLYPANQIFSAEEYQTLQAEVASDAAAVAAANGDVELALKEKAVQRRHAVHQQTEDEVRKRWSYEENVKRPYFHVKPLEAFQLNNWREYLDFEILQGSEERIRILFERCLVVCALYEDYWIKYANYLEAREPGKARDVYRRACTVHLRHKPSIHLTWALYEEAAGNADEACQVLTNMLEAFPRSVTGTMQLINLERRRGNKDKAASLYEKAIDLAAQSPEDGSFLSVQYANFLAKVMGDRAKGKEVLKAAIGKDTKNKRLYLHLLDFETNQFPLDESSVEAVFTLAQESDMLPSSKQDLSERRILFLQQFGGNPVTLRRAVLDHKEQYSTSGFGRKRKADNASQQQAKVPRAAATMAVPENDGVETVQQQQQRAAYQAALQSNAITPGQVAAYYQTGNSQTAWPPQ